LHPFRNYSFAKIFLITNHLFWK